MKHVFYVGDRLGFRMQVDMSNPNDIHRDDVKRKEAKAEEKVDYLMRRFHEMGYPAFVGIFLDNGMEPLPHEIRAMIICDCIFECNGDPTWEQWTFANDQLWSAAETRAARMNEPWVTPEHYPPIPVTTQFRPLQASIGANEPRHPEGHPTRKTRNSILSLVKTEED